MQMIIKMSNRWKLSLTSNSCWLGKKVIVVGEAKKKAGLVLSLEIDKFIF